MVTSLDKKIIFFGIVGLRLVHFAEDLRWRHYQGTAISVVVGFINRHVYIVNM